MLKKIFVALFISVLLPALASAGLVNKKAPDFTLNGLDGKAVSLGEYKGRVVFLDFWASWCPPCKKEMPEINKLAEKFKDSDMAVVGVSVDKKKEHAGTFISTIPGVSKRLTVLHDPESSVHGTGHADLVHNRQGRRDKVCSFRLQGNRPCRVGKRD